MPRQTMSERNSDPFYFETIQCSECCGVDGLLKHKFTDELTCSACVDKINKAFNEAKKEAEENQVKEGYYTDFSYNELLQERNA